MPLRKWFIVALLVAIPINRVFELGGKKANLAASDAVLVFGAMYLLWRLCTGTLRLPLAGICCLCIFGVVLSFLFNLEVSFSNKGPLGIAVELAKILFLWLHFYFLVNVLETKRDFLLALKAWALGSVVVALSGIAGSLAFQLAGIETPFSLMFRAQGTLVDSNLYATHLALSFFLTLLYRKLASPAPRWLWAVLTIQVTGIFFSASRGGMLAFGLSLFAFWVFSTSWQSKSVGAIAFAMLGALVIVTPNQSALLASNPITARLATTTVSLDNTEALQRRQLWEGAVERFLSSPLLGVGRGNYAPLGPDLKTGQVHNTYLEILCETGILGFAAYASFAGYFAFRLAGWRMSPARVLLLAGLLAVALGGVTISIENYRGLWILTGLLEGYARIYGGTA